MSVFSFQPSKKRPAHKEGTEGETDKETPHGAGVRVVDTSAIQPTEVRIQCSLEIDNTLLSIS
jgi:hypothetical protein